MSETTGSNSFEDVELIGNEADGSAIYRDNVSGEVFVDTADFTIFEGKEG